MDTVGQLVQVMLSRLLRCDLSSSTSPVYSMSMSHILPYVFLSREDDDDVRDIGKHYFRSVLLHLMLSVVGTAITKGKNTGSRLFTEVKPCWTGLISEWVTI